jgi:hypothetical protein
VVKSLAKSFTRISSLFDVEVGLYSFVTGVDSWFAKSEF